MVSLNPPAKKPKTLRQTTPETHPELAHGAQDEAQDEVKVVEPLADGPQDEAQYEAADDAPHQLEFDEHGYPCIFNHFLCSHGADCATQSDANGFPLICKRFMSSHAADTRSAKEEAAEKHTTKDDLLVNSALAPINPNVRARKFQNLAVAKARAEAGLENTAKQRLKGKNTSPQ